MSCSVEIPVKQVPPMNRPAACFLCSYQFDFVALFIPQTYLQHGNPEAPNVFKASKKLRYIPNRRSHRL
jgi:hypothetical protein